MHLDQRVATGGSTIATIVTGCLATGGSTIATIVTGCLATGGVTGGCI